MVSSTPRPHFTPGKEPVPIVQDAGWAPGPVWTGGKSRRHRDSIPDRPARSSVAIPTELPRPTTLILVFDYNQNQLVISLNATEVDRTPALLSRCVPLSNAR